MKDKIKALWYTEFPTVLTLGMGIVLTVYPGILGLVCRIGGSILALTGIVLLLIGFLKKREIPEFLPRTILFMAGGLALCIVPSILTLFIPLVLGVWLIVSSISDMYSQFFVQKKIRWIGFLLCILGFFVGIFVVTRPQTAVDSSLRLVGIAMIIHSVLRLITAFFAAKYTVSVSDQNTVIETTIEERE